MKKIYPGIWLLIILLVISCNANTQDNDKLFAQDITAQAKRPIMPVLALKQKNRLIEILVRVSDLENEVELTSMEFNLNGTTNLNDIVSLNVFSSYNEPRLDLATQFGRTTTAEESFKVHGSQILQPGDNYFWLSAKVKDSLNLSNKIVATCTGIKLSNGRHIRLSNDNESYEQNVGIALRQQNQDNVDTYRIPGLVTTNKGTLVAVYDNRHNSGVDLQADVDVGMSRSIDGGATWEPMKVIMDMKTYGDLPEDQNGIGDPSVLVDKITGTIWVAAVWAHGHPGKRNWWASKPGMKPETTSQFVLVKSEDDGITWSEPINITEQIKNPNWFLLLQGPGKGITLKDGTLVFPAQYKDAKEMPHSTIIYSKDRGETWKIGTGAKPNTTEAQVVELQNGNLMLNMRDNRGGSRSIYTTSDLGQTWIEHLTSRKALIEPVCMASLISFDHSEKGQILFFSNPNSPKGRTHITIKTSLDQGLTWPEDKQLELHEESCAGYSCMTVIDKDHIGILYEGVKELYFQKINIKELLDD